MKEVGSNCIGQQAMVLMKGIGKGKSCQWMAQGAKASMVTIFNYGARPGPPGCLIREHIVVPF